MPKLTRLNPRARVALWLRPDALLMREADWQTGFAKSIGVFLNGSGIAEPDRVGRHVHDDSFSLLINAHYEPVLFSLRRDIFPGD